MFLIIFYEPAGPRCAEEQTPNTLLVWMPSCHFRCLAVNRVPKEWLKNAEEKKLVYKLFAVEFLHVGEVGIVMENGKGLGSECEGYLLGMLRWSSFGLCMLICAEMWWSTQTQAVHHLPPAFQLDTFYSCMHLIQIISGCFRYWGKLFRRLVVWQHSVEQCWLTAAFQIAMRTAADSVKDIVSRSRQNWGGRIIL